MFFYSIAHYYDVSDKRKNKKYEHILKHIEAFQKIKEINKELIIVSFVDTPRGNIHYENVKIDLQNFCNKHLPNYKSNIIVKYNWGGTIAALWYSFLFLKENKIKDSSYIAHFEEDFGPIDERFFTESKKILNRQSSENIYVGESNKGRIKIASPKTGQNDDNRLYSQPGCSRLAIPEVWTDGGYYFSSLYKLKKIEKKIGIFHKGNKNIKYSNKEDGISIGEVGFPTLLYHSKFNFECLNRKDYFINEWCGGH